MNGEPIKQSTGNPSTGEHVSPNRSVLSGVSYVLGWVTGLIVYLVEKEDKHVRFHAMQSLILFGLLTVLRIVFMIVPVIGGILSVIVGIFSLVLWIVLMVKGFQGERFELPIVGEWAKAQVEKA